MSGVQEHWVDADGDLSTGSHSVGLEPFRTSDHANTARFSVDGPEVSPGAIETCPTIARTSGGMRRGCESGQPVSADYDSPFSFTGVTRLVVIDVDSEEG